MAADSAGAGVAAAGSAAVSMLVLSASFFTIFGSPELNGKLNYILLFHFFRIIWLLNIHLQNQLLQCQSVYVYDRNAIDEQRISVVAIAPCPIPCFKVETTINWMWIIENKILSYLINLTECNHSQEILCRNS